MTTTTLLRIIGGVMVAIGGIWGYIVGFYPGDLPKLLVLLLGGGALLMIGEKVKDREQR